MGLGWYPEKLIRVKRGLLNVVSGHKCLDEPSCQVEVWRQHTWLDNGEESHDISTDSKDTL